MRNSVALRKIFYRPREVFAELKTSPIWLPAAIVLFAIVLAKVALVVDSSDRALEILRTEVFEEAREQSVLEPRALNEAESAGVSKELVFEGPEDIDGSETETFVLVSYGPLHSRFMALTAFFYFLIGLAFEVAYFRIVSATFRLNLNVRHWISFSIWRHIPAAVLAFVGVVLVTLTIGNQSHPFAQANPINYEVFSLIRWIGAPSTTQGGMNIFSVDIYHLDLALIWVLALQAIGFSKWSGKKFLTSFSVVVIPVAILYAVVVWMSADGLYWYVTVGS